MCASRQPRTTTPHVPTVWPGCSNAFLGLALETMARPIRSVRAAAMDARRAREAAGDTAIDSDASDDDFDISDAASAIKAAIRRSKPANVAKSVRREAARLRLASANRPNLETMDQAQWLHLATRDYQCALRLHPYCTPARLNLAAALLAAGKLKAARRQLAAFEGIVDDGAEEAIKARPLRVCRWCVGCELTLEHCAVPAAAVHPKYGAGVGRHSANTQGYRRAERRPSCRQGCHVRVWESCVNRGWGVAHVASCDSSCNHEGSNCWDCCNLQREGCYKQSNLWLEPKKLLAVRAVPLLEQTWVELVRHR